MFAYPVHSYITYQSPARENMNFKLNIVHSMSFSCHFHSITFLITSYGSPLCMVYIYILLFLLLPRYDNDTSRSGRGVRLNLLILCFILLVWLSAITVCSGSIFNL